MTKQITIYSPLPAILAAREFLDLAKQCQRWGTLAWTDIKLRYRRTLIGPFWITLSMATLVFSVGLVYGIIFGAELQSYMPYFGCGIIIWTYISSVVLEGCNVFVSSGGLIKSTPAPLPLHIYRMLARQIIVLAHNAVLILMLWVIFRWPLGWSAWLVVPGLAVVTAALLGLILMFAILCTRFRDIEKIVVATLQLLFLITPIVWVPESIRGSLAAPILELNPFYFLIEVVRGPLLGHPPGIMIWLIATLLAAVSLFVGLNLFGRFRHRVAYWL